MTRDFDLRELRPKHNADGWWFVLGLGLIAAVAVFSWLNAPIGPATPTAGVVQNLNVIGRKCSCAWVRIDDGVTQGVAIVKGPTLRLCRVGDRIPLERRKAVMGFRYSFPPGGCRFR